MEDSSIVYTSGQRASAPGASMRNAKDLTPLRAARQRLIARCGAALRVHLRRENGTGGLRLVNGTEGKIGASSGA